MGKNLTHGIIYDFFKKKKLKTSFFSSFRKWKSAKPYSYASEIIDAMMHVKNLKKKKIIINLGYGDNGIKVKKIVKLFFDHFNIKKN